MRLSRLTRTAIALVLASPLIAEAQLVTPKTVPVLRGDQFDILPSNRWGMANVRIALDDTLGDPFTNPAKAQRLAGSGLFALPYFHSISGDRGGGRSMPLGGYWRSGDWAGVAVGAIQQLNRAQRWCCQTLSERSANNEYVAAALSRRLSQGYTVGGGLYYAGLGAMDGVDLLYAGSDTLQQDGSLVDLRLGLNRDWGAGRSFEVLLVHNRTAMTHDVHFTTWQPAPAPVWGVPVSRWDHEQDRTNIWGVHSQYVRPVGSEGWRLGWLATVNRLSHPKIPNYVLQNIPRDPGTTWAYNLGVGVSRLVGPMSFGIDVILEPMTAETWADMVRDTIGAGGKVIRAGERTIENSFRFANRKVAIGVGREAKLAADSSSGLGFQFGLGLHSINYTLRQSNNIASTFRRQREAWMEWSPSFALRYRSREFGFEYGIRMTCATSGDCTPSTGGGEVFASPADGGGIIAAPSEALRFDSGSAFVHRFTMVIPIR